MGPGLRQTILIDADDTLWENNTYFIEAMVRFLDHMESLGQPRQVVERTVRERERARTKVGGYGSINFAASLVEAFEALVGPIPRGTAAEFEKLGTDIFNHTIELLPRVKETVATLSQRHHLWIVTKGHQAEQLGKIERSGLKSFFHGHEILREKDPASYADIATRHRFDLATTWMVGNSPKSDIAAAEVAGLRTVYIPHRTLWELEDIPLPKPPDLTLVTFQDLLLHF